MYESFTKLPAPIRAAYLVGAATTWLLTLGGRLWRGRVVVLCYHNVRPDQADSFARQVSRTRGRVIPLGELRRARRERGRPRVVYTFDDAYANLLDTVAPLMRREGAPWSVFAVSGVMGRSPTWSMPEGHPDRDERLMSEDDLRSLAKSEGVEVGAHTRTHPSLPAVHSESILNDELEGCANDLERLTGRRPDAIALPHGAFDARVLGRARATGYSTILTLEDRMEPRVREDGVVARFSSSPDIHPIEFRLLIDGGYAWLGGLRSAARKARGVRS